MQLATIGLDLAKNVFQVHGVDAESRVVVRRRLRRAEVMRFFAAQPPCLVGREACAGAHHWARTIAEPGHEVRLMPPAYVKPYVRRRKNDMADAAAIAEAVTRVPTREPGAAAVSKTCSLWGAGSPQPRMGPVRQQQALGLGECRRTAVEIRAPQRSLG